MVRLAAVVFEPGGIGRSRALDLRKISEDCYLRNPKNLLLCALLTAMSISLFACRGSTGTNTGDTLPPGGTAPALTQQTASETVTAGQAASFSVTAIGTAPLSYQLLVNGTASGTNSSTFSIAQTTTAQNGAHIDVKVSNATGSVTSATVTLTVNATAIAPAITQEHANVTATAGQAAAFSVAATGTAPLTYQWFVNGTASGTNSNAFSIAQTTTGQSGAQIHVKVTNTAGGRK